VWSDGLTAFVVVSGLLVFVEVVAVEVVRGVVLRCVDCFDVGVHWL
jgi:hypothetical protein